MLESVNSDRINKEDVPYERLTVNKFVLKNFRSWPIPVLRPASLLFMGS